MIGVFSFGIDSSLRMAPSAHGANTSHFIVMISLSLVGTRPISFSSCFSRSVFLSAP